MIGQTILHYRIRRILRSPSHYFTGRLTGEMKQRSRVRLRRLQRSVSSAGLRYLVPNHRVDTYFAFRHVLR
jgi:hypothetical protein